ncbi:MAG: sugar ABC transporter permease [Proteobacteria bacterium]|nr:sugar ABC transporter permease [Pseudomonadota bacterium]
MTDIAARAERPSIMRFVKANMRDYALLLSLLAIMVFFQITTGGILFTPLNMTNIILQNSYIVIMALGMLLVIIAGHIDLSVGFLSGFVGAIAGVLMVSMKFDTVTSIVVCILMGTLIGALQGWFVARFRIPAFIVTLAGMLIFRGLMIAMLSGRNLGPFPQTFQSISNGYVPDLLAFMAPPGLNLFALAAGALVTVLVLWSNLRARRLEEAHGMAEEPIQLFYARNALIAAAFLSFSWIMASHRGLPNVLITMFALVALFMFITTRTTFGRRVYAMGGNEKAAKLSGINTERITVMIFAIMGALAALAGLVYAARLNSAQPKAGQGLELDVIAACFIGGAAVTGGVGKVTGAVIGAFIMGVMNNGMGIMGVGIDWQQVIKGVVLMLAVFLDVYYKNNSR